MSASKYPTPDQIEFPASDHVSPDQEFYTGWMVQHARLWVLVMFMGLLLLVSIATNFLQVSRYEPAVRYVTLEGAYPVLYNEKGILEIGGVEYEPELLRAMTRSFIESRYGYDWQQLDRINTAIGLMSEEAVAEEKVKIQAANLATSIYASRSVYKLQLDMDGWIVAAKGKGVFEVTITGVANITDAFKYVDTPYPKKITINLTIKRVKRTETNPYGYIVIRTGSDII